MGQDYKIKDGLVRPKRPKPLVLPPEIHDFKIKAYVDRRTGKELTLEQRKSLLTGELSRGTVNRTLMTPLRRRRYTEYIKQGDPPEVAAAKARISIQLINQWMKLGAQSPGTEYEKFMLGVDEAMGDAESLMISRVQAASEDKRNWAAAAFILERRWAERWGPRAQVRVFVQREIEDFLKCLQRNLPPDIFKMVIEVGLRGYIKAEVAEPPKAIASSPQDFQDVTFLPITSE